MQSTMASLAEPYSQAPLTFLDTDIGLEFGADTQGDFEHYEFTLPSQTQTQTQHSQFAQVGGNEVGMYSNSTCIVLTVY